MVLIASQIIRLQAGYFYPFHQGFHADRRMLEGDPDIHLPFLRARNIKEDLIILNLDLSRKRQFLRQALLHTSTPLGIPEKCFQATEKAPRRWTDIQDNFIWAAKYQIIRQTSGANGHRWRGEQVQQCSIAQPSQLGRIESLRV